MDRFTLLFVDDEKNILSSLRRVFSDTDYEILTAESGRQGLQLVKEREVALVLSDYRMPELNGIDFLKQVKKISPSTTRIILTGYADMEVILSAINEGHVYKFIMKPWRVEDLKLEVQKGVERYKLEKEREVLIEKIERQNQQLKQWNETLERRIEEKTRKIKKMNEMLEKKVSELQARDKVLEFLLEVHPLEKSLELILNEIMALSSVHKLAVYLVDPGKKTIKPEFGVIRKGKKRAVLSSKELAGCPSLPALPPEKPDRKYYSGCSKDTRLSDYSIYIPFEKQNQCLGFLLLDNTETSEPVKEEDIKLAAGFASLTAIAVNDFMVTSSTSDIKKVIQEILE